MAKRIFGLGILAIVLVFGMVVSGCDNGNGDGNVDLNGTWIHSNGLERLVLSGANFTNSWRESSGDPWENEFRGTFTANLTDGTIVFDATQEWDESSWVNISGGESFSGNISVTGNTFVLSGFEFDELNGTWTRQ